MVVIAVLAILAAAITPAILQQVVDTKIETTRKEAKILCEAIVGRSDVRGSFGFVGDMGRFPKSFEELMRPDRDTALYNVLTFRGVAVGWKGPYINAGDSKDDILIDAFGRPYKGAPTGHVRTPDLTAFSTTKTTCTRPGRPSSAAACW